MGYCSQWIIECRVLVVGRRSTLCTGRFGAVPDTTWKALQHSDCAIVAEDVDNTVNAAVEGVDGVTKVRVQF